MIKPLIGKWEQFGILSDDEKQLIENLPVDAQHFEADLVVIRDGERAAHCMLLLSGMVCRYKKLQSGRRQIMSFHFPGDILDLSSLILGRIDHSIGSLTPVKVAPIAHATLLNWMERYPRLGRLLWRDTLADAAVFREWVVNIGRRSAVERTAHLLCEVVTRLNAVGHMASQRYDLAVTPYELADATSLSIVHVNRALQELRAKHLVELRGRTLLMLDWDGLQRVAGFDPAYLHQRTTAA